MEFTLGPYIIRSVVSTAYRQEKYVFPKPTEWFEIHIPGSTTGVCVCLDSRLEKQEEIWDIIIYVSTEPESLFDPSVGFNR